MEPVCALSEPTRVLQPKPATVERGPNQAFVIDVQTVINSIMQADMVGVLLAEGHEVGWGPLGPPGGCFSQSQ